MKLSVHFSRPEFACKCGCGFDTVDAELVDALEDVRMHFMAPVVINSACRCLEHNESVGGAKNSQHTKGRAADIVVKGATPAEVYEYLNKKYANEYGIGKYNSFTHIDTRSGVSARWDFSDQ